MSEATLWKWLRPRLPPGHYERIESPTSPGVPDVHYQLANRRRGWIELKHTRQKSGRPFRDGKKGMRRSQILWWKSYLEHNGDGYLIVSIGPDVAVFPGHVSQFLNDLTVDQMKCYACLWLPRRSISKTSTVFASVIL